MKQDSGVILINVLVVLAIGSAITVLMLTSQQNLLERMTRAAAATQAEALALGAETSVVLALRRDMIVAPETDHYGEDWAAIVQEDVRLDTGQFSVSIDDAQSRFNVNTLVQPGLLQSQIFVRLIRSIGLPDSVTDTVVQQITGRGTVKALAEITGLDDAVLLTLAPHVTALPTGAQVNLNTAQVSVMASVLGNPPAVRQLVKQRDNAGFLTIQDLRNAGFLTTNGAGFTSQFFNVTSQAEVGGVTVTLRSQIMRITSVGVQDAQVVSRTLGPT